MKKLAEFQQKLKAPKGQYNNFGKYKYRSCEDIIEAIKPIINPEGYYLIINDSIELIGDRFYVKATVKITNGEDEFTSSSYAREAEVKKGMDESQITGAASSYARKNALNALLAIDDTKDADAMNNNEKAEKPEITPDSDKWQKAVEYFEKNKNFTGIEKHYKISEQNKNKIKDEAQIS